MAHHWVYVRPDSTLRRRPAWCLSGCTATVGDYPEVAVQGVRGGVELWQLSRRLHGVDLNLEHPMKMHTAATGTLVVLGLMLTACSDGDAEITASHQSPNETADQAGTTQSPLEETEAEALKANERLVEAIFTSGIQLDYHPLASPQEAMAAPLVVVGQVRSARVASGDAGPEVRVVVDVARHVAGDEHLSTVETAFNIGNGFDLARR